MNIIVILPTENNLTSYAYFHGIDQHSSEPEWDFLRELFTCHSHFKTIAEIDMQYFSTQTVQHQIRRMPFSKKHIFY